MELGEKIKQARLEKGLSQRQLCGDRLTRNMLSLIENGSGRPSMDTLQYFARQLDKPVSWFLEEQVVLSPNQTLMEQARKHFTAGEYRQVTELLETYQWPDSIMDPEKLLLEALSLMVQAEQAAGEDKQVYARKLMDRALVAGEQTPYFTAACRREWVLTMYAVCPEKAAELAKALPDDSRELMLRARAALEQKDPAGCARILDAVTAPDAAWHYLRGQAAMDMGEYALATSHFLKAESDFPQLCAKVLETCYREQEDYKMAYHYACKQRES